MSVKYCRSRKYGLTPNRSTSWERRFAKKVCSERDEVNESEYKNLVQKEVSVEKTAVVERSQKATWMRLDTFSYVELESFLVAQHVAYFE